jgi:hypothetical protein
MGTAMPCVAVRRAARGPLAAKRSNERWRMGLFQLPRLVREPTGALLWLSNRISNHKSPRSHSRPRTYSTSLQRSEERHLMGVIGRPGMPCRRYVRAEAHQRTSTVSEDQICCVSQIRSTEGAPFDTAAHTCSIEGNIR